MKTKRFNLLAAIFAVLMSVNPAKAQLLEAGTKFIMSEYIKTKEAREKMEEIQPAYEKWIKLLEDYISKTGKVGDCNNIGFKELSNNRESSYFSYKCGIEEDGNIAFLNVKNKVKIDNCAIGSEFRMEFDIRKNYLEVSSFPKKNDCVFFQPSCRTLISGSCPSNMVFVGGGTFAMGCPSSAVCYENGSASTLRQVRVNSFCIGKYEVTQKEWQEVMGNNPSKFKNCGSNCPVEQVSWNDTQEYIRKLNAKTGMNYRLPTEAEWEYAANGGCSSKNYGNTFSGSDDLNKVGWYFKNSNKQPQAVGKKQPNGLGIYDMSGNIKEWVNDWAEKNWAGGLSGYDKSDVDNPKGSSTGSVKITRGGYWSANAPFNFECRVRYRDSEPPNTRKDILGFRLVHTPVENLGSRPKTQLGSGRGSGNGFNNGYADGESGGIGDMLQGLKNARESNKNSDKE